MKYNERGESRIEVSDILNYFKDIDSYYNDCTRYDTLKRMLEDIVAETKEDAERKKGKWINIRHDNIAECDQCGITGRAWMNFCFDCGADMRTPVETARDIVHEAIDNSVWSDIVDTAEIAEMHMAVDDKYTEMTRNKQCQNT